MITAEILTKIAPTIKGIRAENIAAALDSICPTYGINTADIFHEFIANILVESGEFANLEESLNYSAEALIAKFKRSRISIDDCNTYGRTIVHKANQEEIANRIYGGAWGRINLGNINEGDGWLMRGSGPIQTTGRSNMFKFCEYYNKKYRINYSTEQIAVLLRTDIEVGIHSACWFFAIAKNLIQNAINDHFLTIVNRINGGYNGLTERTAYYERAKKYII